jgi:general secretion pathway protein H
MKHCLPRAGEGTKHRGFTLIEILVVIVIIGITLTFALMAFGDFGEKRRILVAGEQFNHYLKLVQHQAIIENSTFGIAIHKNGYQVLRFKAPNIWAPLSSGSIFHIQHFPTGLVIHLQNKVDNPDAPAIIIHSSGNISAFKLDFGSAKQEQMITLISAPEGTFLQKPGSP